MVLRVDFDDRLRNNLITLHVSAAEKIDLTHVRGTFEKYELILAGFQLRTIHEHHSIKIDRFLGALRLVDLVSELLPLLRQVLPGVSSNALQLRNDISIVTLSHLQYDLIRPIRAFPNNSHIVFRSLKGRGDGSPNEEGDHGEPGEVTTASASGPCHVKPRPALAVRSVVVTSCSNLAGWNFQEQMTL